MTLTFSMYFDKIRCASASSVYLRFFSVFASLKARFCLKLLGELGKLLRFLYTGLPFSIINPRRPSSSPRSALRLALIVRISASSSLGICAIFCLVFAHSLSTDLLISPRLFSSSFSLATVPTTRLALTIGPNH